MKPTLRKLAENMLCLAALAAIAAVPHLPVVVSGAIPAEIASLYDLQPWQQHGPDTLSTDDASASNALVYYDWYAFLHDSVTRGDAPLWNPNEFCGVPFMALWSTRVFSPFSIPFYFLPVPDALVVSVFMKLLVAAWGAFYVARRLGFAPAPAFLVGVVFELSSALLVHPSSPLSDTLPWMPLWILFLNRLAVGQLRYWPFGAMALALMLAGGEPLAAGLMIPFGLAFLVFQYGRPWRPKALASSVGTLLVAGTLGTCLLGVQILPYVEWLEHAAPSVVSDSSEPAGLLGRLSLLVPNALREALRAPTAFESTGTCGVTTVLLLLLWFGLRFAAPESLRRRVEGLLVAALVCTGLGILIPLDAVSPHAARSFMLPNTLVLGLIGAAAVEEWVELNAAECKRALKRFFGMLLVVALAGTGFVLARFAAGAEGQSIYWVAGCSTVGIIAVFVLLLGITALKPSRRLIAYGAGSLVAVEVLATFVPYVSHVESDSFFPKTDFVTMLAENGGRVGGGQVIGDWPLNVYGIAQMRGPNAVRSQRFADFEARLATDPLLVRRTASETLLLTKDDIQGPFAMARASLRIKHVLPAGAVLFEDLGVKQRVWVAYDWISEPDGAPDKVSSHLPPIVETNIPAPESADVSEPRSEISFHGRNNHVVIQANLERPGLVILADALYPGWSAYIDDTPTPILAVDTLFRGVDVGEGRHVIEFIYEPESVRTGIIVSAAGAGVLAAGILLLAITSIWNDLRMRRRAHA